jgi:hypothetical protein
VSHRLPLGWRIVLALILLLAGVSSLLLGAVNLWRHRQAAGFQMLRDTPTTTTISAQIPSERDRIAVVTEPILPLRPTVTSSPTLSLTNAGSASIQQPPPLTVAIPLPTVATGLMTRSPSAGFSTPLATPAPPATTPRRPATAGGAIHALRQRLGVGSGLVAVTSDIADTLGFGWYLDWRLTPDGFRTPGLEYVPTIRLKEGQPSTDRQRLLAAVRALPGALWIIGNEPDVKWQDNVRPDVYARLYHDLYTLLKNLDPACQVAIGGVSQPTPLRMRYLDLILDAYQKRYGEPMPVDVWNVHAFILREERDNWGVDIPPGMADQSGRLYEIADHDSTTIFRQQIVDFRHWMKEQGQQEKPLIVTEYGILMPADYGFSPQKVEQFMLDTFEFFRTAADPSLGYTADGGRLVQRWCWYSLFSTRYPTGNLVETDSGELTRQGEAFREYSQSPP